MTIEATPELTPELTAERALRLAARCGNGLLSGAVVEVVEVVDAERSSTTASAAAAAAATAQVLRSALSRMGARMLRSEPDSARGPADYIFVTGDTAPDSLAPLMASRLRDESRLPPIFVAVGVTPDAERVAGSLAALDSTQLRPHAGAATGRRSRRWRQRTPRAQIAEFRLDGLAVALAIPAAQVSAPSVRAQIAESADRIDWASRGMTATAALATALGASRAILGTRVGVSLVLEPKTAALALALRAAGAEVAVFSADSETDRSVATALAELGVTVFAPTLALDQLSEAAVSEAQAPAPAQTQQSLADADATSAATVDAENAAALLRWGPELLIDDGSHLVRLAHTEHPGSLGTLRAASEETTSGVRPLIEMAAEEKLLIPVIAVNDARTKSEFDNRIGTGQSCVFAIADLLDSAAAEHAGLTDSHGPIAGVAGTRWVVVGYGPVGVGVARFASALGAQVTVVERDPVRALQALHDGHEADTLVASLPYADVAVSATGVWHTMNADNLALLRPGAAVAVAGGIDDELALEDLRGRGWRVEEHGPHVATWRAPSAAAGPLVLAHGGGVNYTAAEGNPIEVMDLSFATQLSSLGRIAEGRDVAGVHALDVAAEWRVAAAALVAHGAAVEDACDDDDARPGGAAQHWTAHRYRSQVKR